jgi:O-antigen ligase
MVVALCLPVVFLHVRYQPGFAIRVGSTSANAYLSDFAVVGVAAAAFVAGVRKGFSRLRPARWIWGAAVAFLLWTFVGLAIGRHVSSAYPVYTHAATAAKFTEYALLAPALPLVLRTVADLATVLRSLTVWSIVASSVGVVQFLGASILLHGRLGGRQGSFLSDADFSALSGAVLLIGLVAFARPRTFGRRLAIVATATGAVGLVLGGAVAGIIGLATAVVVSAVVLIARDELPRRTALAALAVAVVAGVGVVALRGGDIASFARFAGISSGGSDRERTVQTYAHRTLLAWIGLHVWRDHPALGAGWEAAGDPDVFTRYLPAAHRHFPTEPALAFPTRAHPYNVQNVWIEALADLGVVGLVLLVSMFATVIAVGWRAARRLGEPAALLGLGWTALVVWLWTAQSFVAGIPLDAVTWLGFGLVATGAARMET